MSLKKAYFLIFLVLLVDQVSKIYIKTHFVLREEVSVFSWFKILFIENEGMAWGTVIPGAYGKIILTVFRMIVSPIIAYWLWDSVKKKASNYLIVAVALIFAGAVGNLFDSVFYGVIFNDSFGQIATMFSANPYGQWLQGKVVDMFYFPIIRDYPMPEWVPFFGGKEFTFFNAIFNVADMSISVGVGILLLFNKKAFHKEEHTEDFPNSITEKTYSNE